MRRAKKHTKARIKQVATTLSARLERAEEALRKIIHARDYCIEKGVYPDPPNGPTSPSAGFYSQSFKDWAADLAEEALDVPK